MDTFSSAPTSPRMRNTQLVGDDCQFQIVSEAICLIIFRVHANLLLTVKVKILMDIKVAYCPLPPIMLLLSLEWVTYFEHVVVQSLLNTCVFGVRSYIHT